MSDESRTRMSENDPLFDEIRKIKAANPAPALSSASRAAIVHAARSSAMPAVSRQPLGDAFSALTDRLSGGLETLLRPVAIGTLGLAGLAGLAAGGLLAAPAYAELTPEQELASHFEFAVHLGSGIFDDQTADGVN